VSELDELILWWLDYLTSQGTIFDNPIRQKVRDTIKALEKLKKIEEGDYMSDTEAQELKIYEITNRTTGEKSYQPATNAEDACKQAGWLIGDCYANPQKPTRKPGEGTHSASLVKMPCQVCPFQYAECKKPAEAECNCQPNAPELQEWLKQIAQAHLCEYAGEELTKKDYNLGQKWLPMADAIKELTPEP